MRPARQKHPEMVYRKTTGTGSAETSSAFPEAGRRSWAPALAFLIIGFVLLLGLISAVGYLSVKLMDDVGFTARDVGAQRSARWSYCGNFD